MRFHLRDESVKNVVTRRAVVLTTLVIGEVVLHGRHWQLLLEAIDLVEEENDAGLGEPSAVADRVEQCECFLHAVDCLVLEQQLVVLRDGDQEQDGGNILEAVYPLLALRTLATHVEHAVCKVANDECCFRDTGGLHTGSQDVRVRGNVSGRGDGVDGVEVVLGAIIELILATPLESGLHACVRPQSLDSISNIWGKYVALDLCRLHEDSLHMVFCSLVVKRQF